MASGTIIITGCASGLGLHSVKHLFARADSTSYNYIFTVRTGSSSGAKELEDLVSHFNSSAKNVTQKAQGQGLNGDAAPATIQPEAEIQPVDLCDLDAIRTFAAAINNRINQNQLTPIRALVLNAGLNMQQTNKSPQAASDTNEIEIHFQTNYLANFLLSLLLLGSIDKTAGRIVYLSSWSHDSSMPINKYHKPAAVLWKDDACEQIAIASKIPQDTPKEEAAYGGSRRYGASKLWFVMGMLQLQTRLQQNPAFRNISLIGVDPGGVLQTRVTRYGNLATTLFTLPLKLYTLLVAQHLYPNGMWRSITKSSGDVVSAALDSHPGAGIEFGVVSDPEGKKNAGVPGGLYLNGSELGVVAAEAKDRKKQELLWTASVRFSGLKQDETVLELS